MSAEVTDSWHAGASYEAFMGRWSRRLAEEFIRWLRPPPDWDWLDVGTGTGGLAAALCALAGPKSVLGCDSSRAFIDFARSRVTDPRVRFEVADAEHLPPLVGGYDAVVSGLALNFFPDPRLALERQVIAARPGGCIGAFVWDYAEGMEFLRVFWDAAAAIDPHAADLDEARRFPLCSPRAMAELFESVGVTAIRSSGIRIPTVFRDFDDYWRPFLGGVGPAPSFLASLTETQRSELAMESRARLRARSGESIELSAHAWAVVGETPATT